MEESYNDVSISLLWLKTSQRTSYSQDDLQSVDHVLLLYRGARAGDCP